MEENLTTDIRRRLIRYSLPGQVVSRWEKRFGGVLLPLQARALESYNLLDGASLCISAPTSSGKTFCGELALMRSVARQRKGMYLVPLKAVAEEKYRQLRDEYAELGLRIVIGTRDHPEFDSDIESGRFDLAVLVYEKFNALLLTNFDLLGQVGTIVVDEVHMLEDPQRGPRLELALSKLRGSSHRPQIVALSAVLGEATMLADWLGCRLLLETTRPVELRRGVALDGSFQYRCHNSGRLGREGFGDAESREAGLFENLLRAYRKEQPTLIFLKTRGETVRAAHGFAEYAGLEADKEAEEWFASCCEAEEPSSLLDNLRPLVARRVAFHNADLTAAQRKLIEEGYRSGRLRTIFATTTLATGINLPAAMVFIEAQKYQSQGQGGRPELEPLSWAEYENMSGRAGRVGYTSCTTETARAVVFAESELEKRILWEYYIEPRQAMLRSALGNLAGDDIILDIVASDRGASPEAAQAALAASFHSMSGAGNPFSRKQIEDIYNRLLESGLIVAEGGRMIASPFGKAAALAGISVAGGRFLLERRGEFEQATDAELIFSLLETPDAGPLYLPRFEHRWYDRHRNGDGNPDLDVRLVRKVRSLRRALTPGEKVRLTATLVLSDWIDGRDTLDIEHAFGLSLGSIDNLARHTAWLVTSLAALVRAADYLSPLPGRLDVLAGRLRCGLPAELLELQNLTEGAFFRGEYLRLRGEGVISAGALLERGAPLLGKVVDSENRLEKLTDVLPKLKERIMSEETALCGSVVCPQSIEIDGTPVRERYLVRINGRSFPLTGKSFKYLVRLAWSRIRDRQGWLYKEDLEHGFNQARYLYRLRQEIGRDFLPNWPLYENNRNGYYRLLADSEAITVNLEALRDNPDFEIRQIAEDLAGSVVN